jgi:protein SCO1
VSASRSVSLVAAVLAVIVLAAGCIAGPQTLPRFALTNQSGEVVRAEHLNGRIVVVSFMFTSCYEACPLVIHQLARVQTELAAAGGLGSTVRFISITLDPVTDTPEALRGYAAKLGADSHTWDFLTGDLDEVRRVSHAMGVSVMRESGRIGHDTPVLLVDAHGRIVRRYTDPNRLAARLVADLRHLRPGTTVR